MAAPLSLQRLSSLTRSSIYTKCGLPNKSLVVPFTQAFSSFGYGSHQYSKGKKKDKGGARNLCSHFPFPKTVKTQPAFLSHSHSHIDPTFHTVALRLRGLFTNDLSVVGLLTEKHMTPWCLSQCRHYGRKVKPKPPRITHFEYSGDLRTLPEIDTSVLLYPYIDFESEMDENIKKITSFEFASVTQQNKHLKQLIEDRMIELFGPDCELEMEIALRTLRIRQMIPYCIRMRVDKGNKIWLLKTIFRRRRLLNTLRQLDHERFEWLLRELKIRYVIPTDREEFKGWKHNVREATKEETLTKKREKLEEFREKLQGEKEEFHKQKEKIVAEIEKDLESFGLDKDFLDSVQVKERYRKKYHKILNWEERVKLGMTGKIKDYYG